MDAELCLDLGPHDLDQIEVVWGPARREIARTIAREHGPNAVPQHWHWDWRRKGSLLQYPSYRCIAVRCRGEMQAVAILDSDTHRAKIAPDTGKPLMYIDFLEVAPWNTGYGGADRRLKAAGAVLVRAAIELSTDAEFRGRIGLHALPQSEAFYDRCGMTRLDPDPNKENLRYYEMTAAQAASFVNEGGGL